MCVYRLKENMLSAFFMCSPNKPNNNSIPLNQSCGLSLTAKWNGGEHCARCRQAKLSDRSDRKPPAFARIHSFVRYNIFANKRGTCVKTYSSVYRGIPWNVDWCVSRWLGMATHLPFVKFLSSMHLSTWKHSEIWVFLYLLLSHAEQLAAVTYCYRILVTRDVLLQSQRFRKFCLP